MKPSILIVGAGPSGLTAALELSRRGFTVSVIEKRETPSGLSRAVGIMPSTLARLEPSGVSAMIEERAIRVEALNLYAGARRIGRMRMDVLEDPRQRLFAMPQDETENILRQALEKRGGRVRFGHVLRTVVQDADGVDATINGHVERFDHIIGADGVHSTVRMAAGIAFPGQDLDEDWGIADVEDHDWPDPRAFHAFFLPRGEVAVVVPLGEGRHRVIGSEADVLTSLPRPISVSRIRRQGSFRISIRQADAYRNGRIFLVGDAAHCHSPVGGRGMNLGMADACDLAARFEAGTLDGYHEARHAAGAEIISLSERARKAVMGRTTPLSRPLVGLGLRLASFIPALNRAAVRTILNAGPD